MKNKYQHVLAILFQDLQQKSSYFIGLTVLASINFKTADVKICHFGFFNKINGTFILFFLSEIKKIQNRLWQILIDIYIYRFYQRSIKILQITLCFS